MAKKSEDDWLVLVYLVGGYILGVLAAVVIFIGSWMYCVSAYGYLVGVSFGWFPSAIVATIGYGVVRFLWPVIAVAGAYLYQR